MKPVGGPLTRLILFAAAMAGVLVVVITAIQRPIDGETRSYRAMFTDANGLKAGDDIRMRGVAVGKVREVGLAGAQASVALAVRADAAIFDNSVLAIRYQNMTGQRYVDIQQPAQPGARLAPGTVVGTTHTVPSFDVTELFNGLQPVLATLSPEAFNKFAESMVAVIEGDESGLGSALDAVGALGSYVTNRQQVISTLVGNLAAISDRLGGRSQGLVSMFRNLADVYDSLQVNMNGLLDFALTAPPVLYPLDSLLATAGLTVGDNPDVNEIVRRAFPDPQEAVDTLGRLPAALAALSAAVPNAAGPGALCSKGDADVPPVLRVLLDGQPVQVCSR
ncbi:MULTISPECIES: MlaD family protein [unclassified Nocardia]|uniref:MlaD family protein n=1 Tax=unclassified Nocardia TaxID=2637762 RepID=UPI0033A6B9BF